MLSFVSNLKWLITYILNTYLHELINLISEELPVTICVITLGILAVFFAYVMIKVKSQRNPPKWLFCEQFYIAYTYLLTCRSLFIIFTFVWKWNRMPSWGYIKSLSFVLWTEQRVVNTLCISRSLMKNIS